MWRAAIQVDAASTLPSLPFLQCVHETDHYMLKIFEILYDWKQFPLLHPLYIFHFYLSITSRTNFLLTLANLAHALRLFHVLKMDLLCSTRHKVWIWTNSSIRLLQQTHRAEQKTIGPQLWQFEWWLANSDIQSNIMHRRLLRCWKVTQSELLHVKKKMKKCDGNTEK